MEGSAFVFAVVEFVDEESVSVIHQSWIESSDQGIYCYWPPTSANISSRVRKGEIPDKALWAKYKIRVFNYTDDYELARYYASKALDTSNLESEKEKRSKRRPRRYSDSSDSDEIDYSRKRKKVQQNVQRAKVRSGQIESDEVEEPTRSRLCLPEPPAVSASPARLSPAFRNISQVMAEDVIDSPHIPSTSNSSKRCNDSSFQVMVLQKLNAVIENQKAIISAIKQISTSGRADGSSVIEDLLPQPLNKIDELERLRESLKDDQYKRKMVLFLTSQGGHDYGDCLRRMMKRIGSNRLWAEYSLRGQKKKKAFEQHPICKIAMKCCLKVYPKAKINEMEEVLIDFLKQAPHKKGGPKYKEPKTPRRTMTHSDSDN